jgi:hypothetical protein
MVTQTVEAFQGKSASLWIILRKPVRLQVRIWQVGLPGSWVSSQVNAGSDAAGKGKDKGKYRDLSTAAAKSAAFGRDDVLCGGERKATTKQLQRQLQRQRQRCVWLGCFLSILSVMRPR